MSRHSKLFLTRIDKAENSEKAQFTISLMCADQHFKRSTIIQGDSNTKQYKFGKGVGTFGCGLPEKFKETMLISILTWWNVCLTIMLLHNAALITFSTQRK